MINLESITRQQLHGPRFMLVSLLAHAIFFLAFYPSLSSNVMKPNVPVIVRIITDLPKPKKEQTPIKTKTAALSNADRRAKGPKVLERVREPKHPKVRIMAKAIKPTRPIIPPLEKPLPKPVKQKLEPPKPKEALTAKLSEQQRILPKRTPPPLPPSQGVPKLRKLPLLSGADLERYASLDQNAEESEVVSLDTRDFRYISYFATIKRQIELVWNYPEEAARAGIFGELMLRFTILSNGRLEDVRLLRSSGSRLLDDEAVRAVKMANPYNRFPKRITKRRLQINAVFSYMPSLSALR
ncbi:MAG: energy transducer TonB [bacterium]|nr:energy transducer TonB [bacterium]